MKKTIILFTVLFIALQGFCQPSDKYLKAMQERVVAIDSTRNPEGLKDLSNSFERIADAEKTQWLPYYYAALAEVNAAYQLSLGKQGMAATTDPMADRAEQLLMKAEALNKDNSEIYIVKKMIATLRMTADPMNRYMQYGPQAQEALEKAKQLNPNNPRIYLLEGEDKYFTPEQYGGSKTEAKTLFEEALKKYDAFKPASPIDPDWGRSTTQYFLSQVK
jgi:hypothetical protein